MGSIKARANNLDGRTWERYSISVWNMSKLTSETEWRHPASFPEELPRRLIEIYTGTGEIVLDPFVGSGTTLVAALSLGRVGVGLDLNPEYISMTEERLKRIPNLEKRRIRLIHADAENLLDHVNIESIDFVVTSPPYWRVHNRTRTADRKRMRPYSDSEKDLGNVDDYDLFLDRLLTIFRMIYKTLKPGCHCAVIVMDIRVKSTFIPFHLDFSMLMKGLGYILEDIIIWDRRGDYNRLRPLGYPFVFVVNKVHEYILLFRKPRSLPCAQS